MASAFALHPEVILLDEPTSGVSTSDKHAVHMEVLVRAAARMGVKAIIRCEHDMDIVFGYSDRIVALHQGRVLADTTPALLQANDDVMATSGVYEDHHCPSRSAPPSKDQAACVSIRARGPAPTIPASIMLWIRDLDVLVARRQPRAAQDRARCGRGPGGVPGRPQR